MSESETHSDETYPDEIQLNETLDPLDLDGPRPVKLPVVEARTLELLGNQLVWKIGRDDHSGRIVVRVGYASATSSFADLPKLASATDLEIAEAAKHGDLVVEWIE